MWGADSIAILESKAQDFFEDLRQKVRILKAMKLPPDLAKLKAGNDSDLENKARAEKKVPAHEEALSSPEAQFGLYHMKQGGSSIGPRTEGQPTMDRLLLRLEKVWEQLTTLVERCKNSFAHLFKSKNISVEAILSTLGLDLLDYLLGVVESIAMGVLGSFNDLLVELADGINTPISIPVLSPLHKKLTRGSSLTILDAIALSVTIPTTIVYKTVTGKSPMEIPDIGPLAKADAFKSELDERMGRAKAEIRLQEPEPPSSQSVQVSAMMQTHALKLQPIIATGKEGEVARSVSLQSIPTAGIQRTDVPRSKLLIIRNIDEPTGLVGHDAAPSEGILETLRAPAGLAPSMQLHSLTPSASSTSKKLQPTKIMTAKQREQLERTRKRFDSSSGISSKLIKIAVPVGSLLWYKYKTFPALFVPGAKYHPIDAMWDAGKKLVLWLLQFGGMAGYSAKNLQTGK